MQKILKQSYQPLTFERFFAIYMMWYEDETVRKFHGEVFPSILTRELGEVEEGKLFLRLDLCLKPYSFSSLDQTLISTG